MFMETIVESGTITEVGYDKETQTLRIRFKGGNLYEYQGVPHETYRDLNAAQSKGSFYNLNIRVQYQATKVVERKEAEALSGNS